MSNPVDAAATVGENDLARVRRLRWRCRRGMRELDQLLERRLDVLLTSADDAELSAFEQLLACEDDQLWRWCLGHERPGQARLADQIDALRADHPP